MSQSNVEIVRKSFAAIAEGDLDRLLPLYDPDIDFRPLTGTRVERGGYRGHAGVREYFAEAAELWEDLRPIADTMQTVGDHVIVFGHCSFRGRTSKVESDDPMAWVITVRDGKIVRHHVCRTQEEALEAAGMQG